MNLQRKRFGGRSGEWGGARPQSHLYPTVHLGCIFVTFSTRPGKRATVHHLRSRRVDSPVRQLIGYSALSDLDMVSI